jgi:hypothetical protein
MMITGDEQRVNGVRARPAKHFTYSDFLLHLAQERVDQIREERRRLDHIQQRNNHYYNNNNNNHQIYWIEKLLQTSIGDCRK